MRSLVLEYYALLRSALRTRADLRCCLKRCKHCRIFFLTHPCNADRSDLRCPFGCRETHRKRRRKQRSLEYYRGEKGKKRKAIHNRKRYLIVRTADDQPAAPAIPPGDAQSHEPIVVHVRMVISLLERRRVSWDEIARMLKRNWRQHSLTRWREVDYSAAYLKENPP